MKVVVPRGMLLPGLDITRSTEEFDRILGLKGFKALGRAWPPVVHQALAFDNKFKSGEISSDEFRLKIIGLLSDHLQKNGEKKILRISNEEFDQAWNAMLGDVTTLKTQVEALQKDLPEGCDLILTSGTNPIQNEYINSEVSLGNIPLYISYSLKKSPEELYDYVIQDMEAKGTDTILIIKGTTQHQAFQAVKERENGIQGNIQKSIESKKNVYYKELDPKSENLVALILEEVNALLPKNSPHP